MTGQSHEGGAGLPAFSAASPRVDGSLLGDRHADLGVGPVETAFAGAVWEVKAQELDFGDGERSRREWLEHPGAVAVLAVREAEDGQPEVALIEQYRHPVRTYEWEVPAGMLDVDGEPPHRAAARELAEEVDLEADTWHLLADFYCSPGSMSEAIRIYLARDLRDIPEADRHAREHEEKDMATVWVRLDEAVDAVLAGRLHNPSTVVGLLALDRAVARGWGTLRPADAPWPAHPALRTGG